MDDWVPATSHTQEDLRRLLPNASWHWPACLAMTLFDLSRFAISSKSFLDIHFFLFSPMTFFDHFWTYFKRFDLIFLWLFWSNTFGLFFFKNVTSCFNFLFNTYFNLISFHFFILTFFLNISLNIWKQIIWSKKSFFNLYYFYSFIFDIFDLVFQK